MRAKDVALMGFIGKASEYINENPDKADMIDLSNEELEKIKDGFCDLDSLSDNQALMEEGKKAFDKYIDNKLNATKNIFQELGEIFGVDFDDENEKNVIEDETEADVKLSELLSAYETSEDLAELEEDNEPEITEELIISNQEDEEISEDLDAVREETEKQEIIDEVVTNDDTQETEEPVEEEKQVSDIVDTQENHEAEVIEESINPVLQEETSEVSQEVIEEVLNDEIEEANEVVEEFKEGYQEEPMPEMQEDFGISDDDEFLNQIANAAAKSDEELKTYNNHIDAEKIIFDVESKEDNIKIFDDIKQEKEEKEVKIDINDVFVKSDDSSASLSKRLRNIGKTNHYTGYNNLDVYNLSEEDINDHDSKQTRVSLLSGFKGLFKTNNSNEKIIEENEAELKAQKEAEVLAKEEVEQEAVLQEEIDVQEEEIKQDEIAIQEEETKQEEVSFPSFTIIENPGVDAVLTDDEYLNKEETEVVEEEVNDEEPFIKTNDDEKPQELQEEPQEELQTEQPQELEPEVQPQEVPEEEAPIEETKQEEPLQTEETLPPQEEKDENEEYIDSLISDLKDKIANDKTAQIISREESKNEIYARIAKIYSHLSDGFIRTVYDLKEPLAKQYAIGETIIVLHRANFNDLNRLREFVEVMMSHNYSVNVDEKKMIVDTFKEFVNTDGKILTNIFEVANQARVLSGNYEGYKVIKRDE